MGNLRVFFPILLSLLIAVGGSYFLNEWIKNQRTAQEKIVTVKEANAVPVVVAQQDLTRGTIIDAASLTTTRYFEESRPDSAFSTPEELLDRVLVASVKKGEPILESRLAPTDIKQGGISAVLTPGTRAISVKGDKVLGVAGLINPGHRVDVLVTLRLPEQKEDITKTILEDISVLASGTQIVENSKGEPSPVDVYTLEVTPDQGERLTLAANEGRLQFALRSPLDTDLVSTKGVTLADMLGPSFVKKNEPPEQVKPEVKPVAVANPEKQEAKKKVTVEFIKGLTLTAKQVEI